MDWLPVAVVLALAMGFGYTNGFHDAANAVATSVSTRALTPKVAVVMAAVMNLIGAFAGVRVAQTIGTSIVALPGDRTSALALCAAALVGAIVWNLATWWRGLPSSSSHALIGGLGGAALAAGATVHWAQIRDKVLLPMVLSPVIGLVAGWLLMALIVWVFRRAQPAEVSRGFRYAQTVSAAAMAFGHGMQDAGKAAGVVLMALAAGGHGVSPDGPVPWWVLAPGAVVMSIGTYAGGWRIIRTLGRRLVRLSPPQGFAAETAAAGVLYVATATGAPVSTTHAITAAITGTGAVRGVRRVRWRVFGSILLAWALTFPAAGVIAAAAYGLLHLLW